MAYGISGRQLNSYSSDTSSAQYNNGIVKGSLFVQTTSGVSSYKWFPEHPIRVTHMSGVMSGAGAASDTFQLKDGAANAISDAVDVSALGDKSVWNAATIDDAYSTIDLGESLELVTASGAVGFVEIHFINVAS